MSKENHLRKVYQYTFNAKSNVTPGGVKGILTITYEISYRGIYMGEEQLKLLFTCNFVPNENEKVGPNMTIPHSKKNIVIIGNEFKIQAH